MMNVNAVPTPDDDGRAPREIQPEFRKQREKIDLIKKGKVVDKRDPIYRTLFGVKSDWETKCDTTKNDTEREQQEKKERRMARGKARLSLNLFLLALRFSTDGLKLVLSSSVLTVMYGYVRANFHRL